MSFPGCRKAPKILLPLLKGPHRLLNWQIQITRVSWVGQSTTVKCAPSDSCVPPAWAAVVVRIMDQEKTDQISRPWECWLWLWSGWEQYDYVVGPLSLSRVCCKKLGAMFTQINLYSWGDFIDIQNEHVRFHVWNFPPQYWNNESERYSETRCMDIEAQCLPSKFIRCTSHYSHKY